MKHLRLIFNLILVIAVTLCLATVGLRVFDQLQFQLTDPRGGDSMWPMTFMGFAVLASVLAPIAACSVFFNHSHTTLLRASALTAIVFLLGMWIYSSALLLREYESFTGPSGYSYPAFNAGRVFENMIGFDGGPFMAIALILFSIPAIAGRGPVTLLTDRFAKRGQITPVD